MSAQLCTSSSPALVVVSRDRQQPVPTSGAATLAEAPRSGFLAMLAAAFRKRRNEARLRHLAAYLDEHMLQDLGAPTWLMNEAALKRDLAKFRDVDYLRW